MLGKVPSGAMSRGLRRSESGTANLEQLQCQYQMAAIATRKLSLQSRHPMVTIKYFVLPSVAICFAYLQEVCSLGIFIH